MGNMCKTFGEREELPSKDVGSDEVDCPTCGSKDCLKKDGSWDGCRYDPPNESERDEHGIPYL